MAASDAPILLTGSTGQVGSALLPLLREFGEVTAPRREEFDLGAPESIRAAIRSIRPRWIINPAAYTAVDRAESEAALAYTINAEAVRVLGEEAHALGVPVIHFSTDYVFDGEGDQAWREVDRTGPLGVYGRSKLGGEQALAETGAAHVILRTSWVYGATGQNFLRTMLRLGRERPVLRVVDDQYGTPTASGDLAELVMHLLRSFEHAAGRATSSVANAVRERGGVVHAAGGGDPTTWCGFARRILAHASAANPDTAIATVEPISTAEYLTPARRPANSRLCGDLLAERFDYRMPEWKSSLARVMTVVLADEAASSAFPDRQRSKESAS